MPEFKYLEGEFSFAHLKCEGAPLHPNDMDCDLSREAYARQLKAYNEFHSIATPNEASTNG
jgi:hypothetical protein